MKARRIRFLAALAALVGVLFSQLAVAAYACPGVDSMAQAPFVAGDEMPDCHKGQATDELAALCQAHCQQGDQSIDRLAAPPMAMPTEPVALRLELSTASAPSVSLPSLLARPTGPPAAVRHCRFLI